MNNRISNDDAFEVSDSTDWLETPLRSLTAVDSALRCQVCKDFYTTPMITSCAHTFCSLCIRRCLSNDGKCPACRGNDQELKLRFNGAMEELVQAFVKARPEVLEHARKPMVVAGTASPKRDREDAELEEEGGPRKRTRSSQRLQPKRKTVVMDSDLDEDEDYVPEAGYVLCPVCSAEVKEETINAHLDRNCEEEPKRKPSKTSVKPLALTPQKPTKPPERLAQVNYSMLKDGPLRKKLTDQGLSAAGGRTLLEKRYTEWVTLWNANCDATKPKAKGDLRREMKVWERTQGGSAPSSGAAHSTGAQIRDKDFDGVAWSSKHDGDFQKLIANARRKAVVKSSTPEPASIQQDTAPVAEALENFVSSSGPTLPDTEMANASEEDLRPSQNALPLLTASQDTSPSKRRFFQESNDPDIDSGLPPSSQYRSSMSVEKDSGINSDIATLTSIEP